ncbi:transporter substrate-binding domain-containing protein [Enterococcus hailinensis]|uniref:transporter substrate-binding domain-containing protein n=1 Tax=Enterococcus hailinensis TaxID=3238988 RepID=UPI0038B28842
MKKIALVLVALTSFLILTGCDTKKTATTNSSDVKKTIVVGTSGVSKPFSYEKDGQLTGYDVEVVKAIFKGTDYKVKFEKTEFESILSGVDSGRYQLGVNNFSYNEERGSKYTFSYPIITNPNVFTVRKDDDSIKEISDLGGKKAVTEVGNSGATILENYNKENPDNKVNITYSEVDFIKQFEQIEAGQYDVRIISKVSAEAGIKEHGFKDLKTVAFTSEGTNANAYVLLGKDADPALQKTVNDRIKELVEDGTLAKISQEQLGGDYVPKTADLKQP